MNLKIVLLTGCILVSHGALRGATIAKNNFDGTSSLAYQSTSGVQEFGDGLVVRPLSDRRGTKEFLILFDPVSFAGFSNVEVSFSLVAMADENVLEFSDEVRADLVTDSGDKIRLLHNIPNSSLAKIAFSGNNRDAFYEGEFSAAVPDDVSEGSLRILAFASSITEVYRIDEVLFTGDQIVSNPLDLNMDGTVTSQDLDVACAMAKDLQPFLDPLNTVLADLDFDGAVAFGDFLILSTNFSQEGGYSQGNINCDESINFADFLILSSQFGKTTLGSSSVPEPASLCSLTGTLALCFLMRKRR